VNEQKASLEDLLHKPVARIQKNALVLNDLIKYTPEHHPDYQTLGEALAMNQSFLDEFNMIQTKSMFPVLKFEANILIEIITTQIDFSVG
jgi:active breakpoint cluster region-related protein